MLLENINFDEIEITTREKHISPEKISKIISYFEDGFKKTYDRIESELEKTIPHLETRGLSKKDLRKKIHKNILNGKLDINVLDILEKETPELFQVDRSESLETGLTALFYFGAYVQRRNGNGRNYF